MPLLKSQRADLHGLMSAYGLVPEDFDIGEAESDSYAGRISEWAISHRSEGFAFLSSRLEQDEEQIQRHPGKDRYRDSVSSASWTRTKALFEEWCAATRRELEAVDPWEALAQSRELVRLIEEDEQNRPFTPDEREAITTQLRGLREQVEANTELGIETRRFIAQRLDYLDEAAERLGKKDWLLLALGTISNIVVGVALNPVQTATIVERIFSGVRGLMG